MCVYVTSRDHAADYERAWRAKERADAEKKAAQLADILESREQMAVQKQRVLSQAAQMEKEQFERILQVSSGDNAYAYHIHANVLHMFITYTPTCCTWGALSPRKSSFSAFFGSALSAPPPNLHPFRIRLSLSLIWCVREHVSAKRACVKRDLVQCQKRPTTVLKET